MNFSKRSLLAAPLLFAIGAVVPRGFFPESAAQQKKWEERYRSLPDAAVLRETMRILSAEPHHLGSEYGEKNARWILARMKEWGLDARIETFHVLFPTPKERLVELVEPVKYRAALAEPPVAGDPTSSQTAAQLPSYNAYSVDGDVTAPLVYVNYGVPADYEKIEKLGVDVRGKIVIARYGGSWRGIKPKVAAEKGAVGCLIYSDPKDDGYFEGDVYPKGPFRPGAGVQRGSVMDMPFHPGDPLTPGVGATRDAKRLSLEEAKTLTKVPVLPISYGDAQPLLAALGGPVAPPEWRGALPITYHVGPGPAKVHVKVSFDWKTVPLHDVIARIEGSASPDQWVIHGNHHDAWVNGAADPVSGMVALLEEARAFGTLLKEGWRPKRTIVLAAWDGEEQGLLGSTEWAETHAAELKQKAVAYINTDSNGRGFLFAAGSHSLEAFVNEVAEEITDPEKRISVLRRARLKSLAEAGSAKERAEIRDRKNLAIGALGSGSDYTPFFQHLGIASLNFGFGGEDDGGIYHSVYDNFAWYTRFSDTDFAYGRALAQLTGTAVMRLASSDILPFEFKSLSDTVAKYVKEVSDLAQEKRETEEERSRQIEERLAWAVADPKKPFVEPKPPAGVPHLDLSELRNASEDLARAAKRYESAFDAAMEGKTPRPSPVRLRELNRLLLAAERALTREEGLPRRPWYKHHIYAPGFYTGYGVKTLPGVREAIEENKWEEANREAETAAAVIRRAADHIRSAAKRLESDL